MPDLCVIPGDGIGREVIPAAIRVLDAVLPDLNPITLDAGWDCFNKYGVSVPEQTLDAIKKYGGALFGAVSSPSYKVDGYRSAILTMRQELNLYANIRPVRSLPLVSPRAGIDLIVIRENTEGLYVGKERREGDTAFAERVISVNASRRIAQSALEICSRFNRKKITIVHKANILPVTDGLFRDTVKQTVVESKEISAQIELDELLVDVAAFKMASQPEQFDVLVTTNLYGDILSDEAAYWCGGMGFAPSINLGSGVAIAEPVHGSAPDIAGKGVANPIASILSAALLIRFQWGLDKEANLIKKGVDRFLEKEGSSLQNRRTEVVVDRIINYME